MNSHTLKSWPLLQSESGQGLVEFLFSAPLIVMLLFSLTASLGLGWIQLEASALTQEFGVCLLEENRELWCRRRYEDSLSQLPGSFRLRSYYRSHRLLHAELGHRLPFLGREWSFDEPLPQF